MNRSRVRFSQVARHPHTRRTRPTYPQPERRRHPRPITIRGRPHIIDAHAEMIGNPEQILRHPPRLPMKTTGNIRPGNTQKLAELRPSLTRDGKILGNCQADSVVR